MCAIVTTGLQSSWRPARAGALARSGLRRARDTLPAVTIVDLFLIALLLVAAVVGFRRGAILQLFTYIGLLAGLLVGALLAPTTTAASDEPATQAAIAIATLVIAAGIGDIAGWLIGGRLRSRAHGTALRAPDRATGALIGVVAVVLVTWFVALNLVGGPFLPLAGQIRRSAVVSGIDAVMPDPPSLLGGVRRFFDAFGFPDLFVGLPPIPADPVQVPSQRQANRAFDAASESTVRVVGEACGRVQVGSGFVAGPHLVVTNAHVIAGERQTFVEIGEASQQAAPVLVDPRLDLAVLRVADAPGPILRLASGTLPRGTRGAVVGYPGGGGLAGERAAVRSSIEVSSRDIYGRGEVMRRLYELQASVVPGNSGGPFVSVDGRVGGVVVSASTTDRRLGYAIVAADVASVLRRTQAADGAASTGACVR